MSDYVFPAGTLAGNGFDVDLTQQRAGWTYSGLRVATLFQGQTLTIDTAANEFLVLPLSGAGVVKTGQQVFDLAGREHIWGQITDYAFIPRHTTFTLTATRSGQFAFPFALASEDLKPSYCPSNQVRVELRGAGSASRQVLNYAVANPVHTSRLLACEVLTPGGNWSSYPAHKHDQEGPDEHPLEEIYYFRIQPNQHGAGLAFHATYGTVDRPIEVAALIHDGDVALVPHGWHGPCAAAPHYALYYLNVMAGPGPAQWKSVDDPAFHWIRSTWDTEAIDPRLPFNSDGTYHQEA